MIDEKILKNEERAVFLLRSLYRKYGYMPFKMSKFEEYDLYVRNKDFLISDRIITFNGIGGKLLALKPDVTLSIIKGCEDKKGYKQKFFYNENVYRVSGRAEEFKEIMQSGIEAVGDLDSYDILEVVTLALESLSILSDNYVLDISHMGIATAILENAGKGEDFVKKASELFTKRNLHELSGLLSEREVEKEAAVRIEALASLYGTPSFVLPRLEVLVKGVEKAETAYKELCSLVSSISNRAFSERIRIDFSIMSSTKYYSGVVFKGFIDSVSESVLSGGSYDNLMKRMKKNSRAVGFAVYLDLLEALEYKESEFDVDVLLVYSDSTDAEKIFEKVKEISSEGKSVTAQKADVGKIKYRKAVYLT